MSKYLNEYIDLERKLKIATTYEIMDELQNYADWMTSLLQNGRPILEQAQGDRFHRLYQQRTLIWTKIFMLQKAIDIAFKVSEKY